MATVHLHMKNLPREVSSLDIRRFFLDFDIPAGGVQIVGGPDGEAFVTFASYEQLLKATSYDKLQLRGQTVALNLVNSMEIERKVMQLRDQLHGSQEQSSSAGDQHRGANWARSPSPPRDNRYGEASMPWVERGGLRVNPHWQDEDTEWDAKRRKIGDDYEGRARQGADNQNRVMSELEKERQHARDIEEELQRKKDRIERLEREEKEQQRRDMEAKMRPPEMDFRLDLDRRPTDMYSQDEARLMLEREYMARRAPEEARASYPDFGLQRGDTSYDDSMQRYQSPDRNPMRSSGYEDRRPSMDDRYMGDRYSGVRSRSRSPLGGDRRRAEGLSYSAPGFVKMSNVSLECTYKQVRRFFEGFQIARGGIIMIRDDRQSLYNVYIKFNKLDDALNCDQTNGQLLHGRAVALEMIAPNDYDMIRGNENQDRPVFPESAMRSQHAQYNQHSNQQQREKRDYSTPLPPKTGNVRQALFFILVRDLPDTVTASQVLDEYRRTKDPQGRGKVVGAVVIDDRMKRFDRTGYVAFSDFDERNVALEHHEGARPWKDASVYRKFAELPIPVRIMKSHPSGIDVEMPEKERFALRDIHGRNNQREKSLQEREDEQLSTNKFSRALFDYQKKWDKNNPPPERFFLILPDIQENTTACEIWSRFKDDHNCCMHVKLAIKPTHPKRQALVVFTDKTICEKYKSEFGGRWENQKKGVRMLVNIAAESGSHIVQSTKAGTDRVVSNKELIRIGLKLSINVSKLEDGSTGNNAKIAEKPRCYLRFTNVPADVNARAIWLWFKAEDGPSIGVTLVGEDKNTKVSRSAFVAFTDPAKRTEEKKKQNANTSQPCESCGEMKMMGIFAQCDPETEIYTATSTDEDRLVPMDEKNAMKEKYFAMGGKISEPREKSAEQEKLKEPEASPSKIEMDEDDTDDKIFYLKIEGVKADVTACEIWSWFGGPHGSSSGVTLLSKSEDDKFCLIAFNDPTARNEEKDKYPEADRANRKQAIRCIALADDTTDIHISTDSGVDRPLTAAEKEAYGKEYTSASAMSRGKGKKEGKQSKPPLLQPNDFEYIKLAGDDLKSDSTAHGLTHKYPNGCKTVTLIKDAFDQPIIAYIGFKRGINPHAQKWQKTRDRELSNLDADFKIIEASPTMKDRIITSAERQEFLDKTKQLGKKGNAKRVPNQAAAKTPLLQGIDLDYIRVEDLKPSSTAYEVFVQNKGCQSVTLVNNPYGEAILAFVGFEKRSNALATIWQKTRDRELVEFDMDHQIVESTGLLGDRVVNDAEREEFWHLVNSYSEQQGGNVKNTRTRTRGRRSNNQDHSGQGIPPLLHTKRLDHIRLTDLEPHITSFDLWKSYKGCVSVTLVNNSFGQAILAFISYNVKSNTEASIWQRTRDRELADFSLEYQFVETNAGLKNRSVTEQERYQFWDRVEEMNANDVNWQKKQQQQMNQSAEFY